MGTSSHSAASGQHGDDPGGADTADSLAAEVRARGLDFDRSIAERLDAAIARTSDRGELGTLYTVRALAFQGEGDTSISAAAAQEAVPHLVAAGRTSDAAFASAMAAVFLDQCGDTSTAVELAVDALVMLGDADAPVDDVPPDLSSVRTALALSSFFLRQSAFELAMTAGRRAFDGSRRIAGVPTDPVALSFGYVACEAAHVTDDDTVREQNLSHTQDVIDWLDGHGIDSPPRSLLVNVLRAEIRHVRGEAGNRSDLDAAESLYDRSPADLVAWHRLVRGTAALLDGRPRSAIEHFDVALPGLEDSSDHHCIVRCLRARSLAHAQVGDHRLAHLDSLDLADRTRRWQIDQVGHLADQLARRAELERSATELRDMAARMSDDIDRDATTGVHSRRWLERHLDELSESSDQGAVIMCDIDRFKNVNDTHGHHVGDAVLHEFATLLDEKSSSHPGGVVARFGGEEFVIVLDREDSMSAAEVAEQIRATTAAHDWSRLAQGLALSVSCGVADGPLSDVRHLLILADQALLDAKRLGRNRVVSAITDSTD